MVQINQNHIYYYVNKYIPDLKLSDNFPDYVTPTDECVAFLTIGEIEQRSGLGLTACSKGSREDIISHSYVLPQKIPFDITSVNLSNLPSLTPASGVFFGKPTLINNGNQNIIIIPAMFSVEYDSFQTNTPEGHLTVFTQENGLFKQSENINFVGQPR